MATIRLGKRTEQRSPLIKDFVPLADLDGLVFGAWDPKAGFCGSLGNLVQDPRLNHRLEVEGGFMEEPSREMLQDFFRKLRQRDRTERWQSG